MIVLEESFDAILQLFREMSALWKLREHSKFLLELCSFDINRIEYTCEVTDCEGIKTDTYNHPNQPGNFFVSTARGNIAIAYCSECLKSPVEANQVLIRVDFIGDASEDSPIIWVLIFKFWYQIENASH